MKKHLPLGIQTFSDIIEGGYLYVDKTQDIYNFFAEKGKYYFLSRPRRFGKSLLTSTLYEIFSGNKELFKDLWIYDKIQWKAHPVITLDFMTINAETPDILKSSLKQFTIDCGQGFGISVEKERNYKDAFVKLIKELSKQGRVVVLIDEYDKPIIDFVENKEIALKNREILRNFYSILKSVDKYIEFVFITGVSKFSKVSIFSDLNNLNDITLDEKYATLLGYTQEELSRYFQDRMEDLPEKKSKQQWEEIIKKRYNGYSWDGKHFVYTPFSILNFFQKKKLANYWFESGSPSFLVRLIKQYRVDVKKLENHKVGESVFNSFDIDQMHVVSLLFQAGYLTIKKIETTEQEKRFYYLSYPNSEVKESFIENLLADFSLRYPDEISVTVEGLKQYLREANLEGFFNSLRAIFAQIPYDIFIKDREAYYQTVIFLILKLIGIDIQTEVETNLGRIDAVIETKDTIYIIEFKMQSAQSALAQIKEKKYFERYLASKKAIKLIGVEFDIESRNLSEYRVEDLELNK
jgi:hypothetical protein